MRAQQLAAPVTVYVEQFSAHPLESDAAALYGPPDGYLNGDGPCTTGTVCRSLVCDPALGGGTRLQWTVPLSDRPPGRPAS